MLSGGVNMKIGKYWITFSWKEIINGQWVSRHGVLLEGDCFGRDGFVVFGFGNASTGI
jgi:hypothetical protein